MYVYQTPLRITCTTVYRYTVSTVVSGTLYQKLVHLNTRQLAMVVASSAFRSLSRI